MKRTILIFLTVFFCGVPLLWAQGENLEQEITSQEKRLMELKNEQARVEQELNKVLKKEKNLLGEIEKLDGQIDRLEKDIARSRKRILELQEERMRLEKEVESLSQRIASNEAKVREVLARVYRQDLGMGFWEFLLESASPSEWEEKWYLLRKYYQFETGVILTHVEEKESLSRKLEEIKNTMRLESTLKEKMALENGRLTQLKKARQEMLAKVNADRQKFQATRQKLAQAQKEVEGMIVALQKKLAERKSAPVVSTAKRGRLLWPVQGGKVIRSFGESKDPRYGVTFYNPGIDVAAPLGSPVVAASSGVVILAQNVRGYGKTIILDHGRDIFTVYAHLGELKVSSGQEVKEGQVIGLVGDTGLVDRPTLHFEVRVGEKAKEENPLQWLE
ncbi:MAG: peptidoglycan DD-metalloendopeptidase family protein [Atribacterota bacterium]